MLNRKLGEYTLPDGWAIIAASNRDADRAARTFALIFARSTRNETRSRLIDFWHETGHKRTSRQSLTVSEGDQELRALIRYQGGSLEFQEIYAQVAPGVRRYLSRWEKDKGMHLDYFLLSPTIAGRLAEDRVDRWVRGKVNASDHAPVWIALDL